MKLVMLIAAVLLHGCCYTHYEDSRVSVSRWALGVDTEALKISVTTTGAQTTLRVGELSNASQNIGSTAAALGALGGL